MIQASPFAPDGSVLTLPTYGPSDFPAHSAILCRNTAPLVSFAFQLIRRNVGCRVLGREIGQGLVTLVNKLKAKDLDELGVKLGMYRQRETAKFLAKGDEQSADAVNDRVTCIELFLTVSDSLDDLSSRITKLFDDSTSSLLTLSTVHKAKGLEWPLVFILDKPKLMPSPWARQPWQREQEVNLIYVAITRAQLDLRYIESNQWKNETKEVKQLNYESDPD